MVHWQCPFTLGIIANLGQTTTTSCLSAIAGAAHTKVGNIQFALYLLFILLQIAMLKGKVNIFIFLQLVISTVKSWVFNFFLYTLPLRQLLQPVTYPERFLVFAVGAVSISLGFTALKCARFLNYPPEAFVAMCTERRGMRFGTGKTILDALYILTAVSVCLVSGQSLGVVREGTLIFALTNGPLINLFMPHLSSAFARLENLGMPAAAAVQKDPA